MGDIDPLIFIKPAFLLGYKALEKNYVDQALDPICICASLLITLIISIIRNTFDLIFPPKDNVNKSKNRQEADSPATDNKLI